MEEISKIVDDKLEEMELYLFLPDEILEGLKKYIVESLEAKENRIKELEEANRWRLCSEELPEEEGNYEVHTNDSGQDEIYEAIYYSEGMFSLRARISDTLSLRKEEDFKILYLTTGCFALTHWRPITPPNTEKEIA